MLGGGSKSREHHWWPVGLQKFWADKNGDLAWISPQGKIDRKRVRNRKIAKKAHGHTIFHGQVWETNFEGDFQSVDDAAPQIVETLLGFKPFGLTPSEALHMFRLLFKRDRHLRDTCRFYNLDENTNRKLLLLILSLLIRGPGNRFRYENYPQLVGLPPNENVGKLNMRQAYSLAKRQCETGSLSNRYYVLLHSPWKRFVFGDGQFDWLSQGLNGYRIDGRALMPLTPHLCIYVCTPRSMRVTPNCASFLAPPWMVDEVNEMIQACSKDAIYFMGSQPKLMPAFIEGQFLRHNRPNNYLIDLLDEVAGNTRPLSSLISWTA
ncbi:hypothetical protein [Rhizobium sp. BK650]|uniref:hypothetical protein n=1 Tax=Rhizobium sp. BK650 TaxID=2586990 RepID=UPI001AED863F|nr:hypothetical protein [Rhizobium sp. BK650]